MKNLYSKNNFLCCVFYSQVMDYYGAIQVLRNPDGVGGVSDFPEKSVTKV